MTLWLVMFGSSLAVFGAILLVWWRFENEKRRRNFLGNIAVGTEAIGASIGPVILKEPPPVQGYFSRWFAAGTSPADAGEKGWSQGGFVLLTAGMATVGLIGGMRLADMIGPSAPLLAAAAMGIVPWRLRASRRRKRMALLEMQFPDALDFLSRSMRAGNAFSVSLELLGAETTEPLRPEIVRLTREMTLGASLEDALDGLIVRVPMVEVRFFVSTVLLQRETGGNLSEVMGKLAVSVRERLRLRGQVRAASGQARMTATVLTLLPVATIFLLHLFSPDYMNGLTNDPVGRNLLAAAVVSQVIGYLLMKKIVNIEV